MWNIAAGQRREHATFTAQGVIALGPQVTRRPAQYVVAPAAAEPYEHVLGSARQQPHIADRSALERLLVHPRVEDLEIDQLAVDSGFLSGFFRVVVWVRRQGFQMPSSASRRSGVRALRDASEGSGEGRLANAS